MGCYVNPHNMSKEQWLTRNADPIDQPSWPPPQGKMFLCWIDNVVFTALGVAYDEREFRVFQKRNEGDTRDRYWFTAPVQAIRMVSDLINYERN